MGVIDDSLCVMLDMKASCGRSDGARATAQFTFSSSFSRRAMSQTPKQHMFSEGVVCLSRILQV